MFTHIAYTVACEDLYEVMGNAMAAATAGEDGDSGNGDVLDFIKQEQRIRLETLAALLPEREGSLEPLATGMLSKSLKVRAAAVTILQMFDANDYTRPFVNELNLFLRVTFQRLQIQLV